MEQQAVDKLMASVAFISPASATPQLVTIFGEQEVAGISIVSTVLYLVIALIVLAYGYFHKLRPIIISQSLWSAINFLIIVGVVMYGSGRSFAINYDALLFLNNFGKTLVVISFGFGALVLYQWYKLRQMA